MLTRLCGVMAYRHVLRPVRPLQRSVQRFTATKITQVATPQSVAYWLYGICWATVIAISLGGVTRLTESGLSMTSWHLIKDISRPSTEEEWITEFERYKTFPEYEAVHSELTLEGFKFIYHWEWGHRNWGRMIGALFILPFFGFMLAKKMSPQVKKRCLVLGGLLGFQGGMGWYMVKSGLSQPVDSDTPIRVSPYRLCAHLGTAFLFFTGTLWTAMDISMANRAGGSALLPNHRLTNVLRKKSMALAIFTYFVAMSGAFVAGNDAGLIYGTYPMMADRWIPTDYWHPYIDRFRNMFENSAAVQFNHRLFAHLLVVAIVSCWFMGRKAGLSGRPKRALNTMLGLVFCQATLGVSCLLYQVPVSLGAAHQLGSVALLSGTTWFAHELKRGNIQKLARKIR